MALVDDLTATTPQEVLTRRAALGKITGLAFAVAAVGSAITTVRFLRPNVLFQPPTRFKLGRPEEIAPGSLLVMQELGVYLAHLPEGFVALSARCTHLGCMTRYDEAAKHIVCPCHGSAFNQSGDVQAGPAPEPLQRLTLVIEDGQLVVDTLKPASTDFALVV